MPVTWFLFVCCFSVCYSANTFAQTINQYQVIGSHNSYKKQLPAHIVSLLKNSAENLNIKKLATFQYSHPSLTQQLNLGLRQLELDVLLDSKGGRFSQPKIEALLNRSLLSEAERNELSQPGLKTLHLPDIDFLSHCYLFIRCLEELMQWSTRNPNHHPVVIMLNVKESQAPINNSTEVLPFNQIDYQLLDDAINKVISKNKLITPDDVRGDFQHLNDAVLEQGWPLLNLSLGKFIFLFDGNKKQSDLYREKHPSLIGRAMFSSYEETEHEAAFMVINNPVKHHSKIKKLVAKGYIVRTRADANITHSYQQLQQQFSAAQTSGAQVISTDFYQDSIQTKKKGYSVEFSKKTNELQSRFIQYIHHK